MPWPPSVSFSPGFTMFQSVNNKMGLDPLLPESVYNEISYICHKDKKIYE